MKNQDWKAEIERAKKGIYKGEHRLKYDDIFWITQEGENVYKHHGLKWTLRNTMEFIIEFEDVLHVADWDHLLSCYEVFNIGEYYDKSEGEVIYPTDEQYEDMMYQVDRLRVVDFVSEIDDSLLPF